MTTRILLGMAAALAALLCVQGPAGAAGDAAVGSLTIEHPWSRATDSMATTGAVYLMVKNASGTPDRLMGAATQVAGTVELHLDVDEGGMIRMKTVDGIDVPAHGSAVIKPGGFHIMLVNLKTRLKAGASYPLTLTFAKAGRVTVRVQVEGSAGPSAPMGSGMGEMKGMDDMKQ